MALRPSILAEVSEDYHLQPPLPPRKRFAADENDILCVEDQVQRIPLAGAIDVKDFVTGVTIALIGLSLLRSNLTILYVTFLFLLSFSTFLPFLLSILSTVAYVT